jgi:hypothetical protein
LVKAHTIAHVRFAVIEESTFQMKCQEHKMPTISFNGKTYNSLEEMPADIRGTYEQLMAFMKDENHNGTPDMFEGDVVQKMIGMATNARVVVNGQEAQGLEALSPEAREKFDGVMQKLGQLGVLQGTPGVQETPFQSAPKISAREPAFTKSPSLIQSGQSAITEDTGPRFGVILLAILGVFILCTVVVAAGYFFLAR